MYIYTYVCIFIGTNTGTEVGFANAVDFANVNSLFEMGMVKSKGEEQ